jgi:hypothetical protein
MMVVFKYSIITLLLADDPRSTVHPDCFDHTELLVEVHRLISPWSLVVQPSHAYLQAFPR